MSLQSYFGSWDDGSIVQLTVPSGGLIGFSCTHGYPHTSPSSIKRLDRKLKGLDMLVFQVLNRLTGSAKVRAVLDADEDPFQRDEWDDDLSSTDSNGGGLASESYLSEFLIATKLNDIIESEGFDAVSITHLVTYNGGQKKLRQAFYRTEVIWLNGKPQSFKELAVAFVAVCQKSSFRMGTHSNHDSVWKRGQPWRLLLGRSHHLVCSGL